MEAATNPNNTNAFPNNLPLHIYKSILLFIVFLDEININKAFSSSLVERIGTSTILNSFVPIKQIAEAIGLKSTRSLRLEINKPESKYISREVKVNGGTSYEILVSSLEPELQQKLREAEKINRYSLSFILVTQIFGRNAIWFSMTISERIIAIIAFQFYLWSAILE